MDECDDCYNHMKQNSQFIRNKFIMLNNNCYNYAMNNFTNTYARPGRKSNFNYESILCSSIREAVLKDISINGGYIINPVDKCDMNKRKICLFIDDNIDFHFYRQDKNNWSHKPGQLEVTNLDGNGKIIKDVMSANHIYGDINYKFCSCFCVKKVHPYYEIVIW